MACCSYKVARRGMIFMNLLVLLFAVIFLGVGAGSLAFGQKFISSVNNYCVKICSLSDSQEVGCNCDSNPPTTTLPVITFQAPAAGLISLGVFALIASIVGCIGAIRERTPLIIVYIIFILLIIIMQFGFGTAAAAVASGAAPEIAGPFMGVLNENYRYFDWLALSGLVPTACYYESGNVTINDMLSGQDVNVTFNYPACNFYGQCANAYNRNYKMTPKEDYCCKDSTKACDTSKVDCISGNACVLSFLSAVAAPVAIVAFLSLCIEITALVFACIVRPGKPGGKYAS